MEAAIVGGGVGGLAAALALARTGWRVEIHEQAPALAEVGAGVQLSPNAVKALRWLGVADALRPAAATPEAIEVRRSRDDRLLARSVLGEAVERRHGAPYWHVLRSDLQRVLLDAARAAGVWLGLGRRVDDARALGPGLVVAADGVRSPLRRALFGSEPARFTGQTAWRGTIPADSLDHPPVTAVRVGPGRHFVSYRVAGGAAVNFVGVVEQEGWTTEGWSAPGERGALAADFAGWPEPVRRMVDACEHPWRWAILDRDPAPRWVNGRIVLLGDAAHPVPPFLAQGAALALEDAVVLARRLAEHGVEDALQLYQTERSPRAARVLRASRRNAFAFHARGLTAAAGQTALRVANRTAPGALGASLDWLYGYDAGSV